MKPKDLIAQQALLPEGDFRTRVAHWARQQPRSAVPKLLERYHKLSQQPGGGNVNIVARALARSAPLSIEAIRKLWELDQKRELELAKLIYTNPHLGQKERDWLERHEREIATSERDEAYDVEQRQRALKHLHQQIQAGFPLQDQTRHDLLETLERKTQYSQYYADKMSRSRKFGDRDEVIELTRVLLLDPHTSEKSLQKVLGSTTVNRFVGRMLITHPQATPNLVLEVCRHVTDQLDNATIDDWLGEAILQGRYHQNKQLLQYLLEHTKSPQLLADMITGGWVPENYYSTCLGRLLQVAPHKGLEFLEQNPGLWQLVRSRDRAQMMTQLSPDLRQRAARKLQQRKNLEEPGKGAGIERR